MLNLRWGLGASYTTLCQKRSATPSVDEPLSEAVNKERFKPLQASSDPIADIKIIINAKERRAADDGRMLCQGCPI